MRVVFRFDADEQLAPSRGAMRAIRPSDVSPPLPGAEVLVDASAFAPQGAPQGAVAVRLYVASRAGAIDKTLHVYGDRTASAPQPPMSRCMHRDADDSARFRFEAEASSALRDRQYWSGNRTRDSRIENSML